MTDKRAILVANQAFYVAFSTGDIAGLSKLWADDDNISCIHPGWPVIVGHAAVIGSWRDILQSPSRPQITCHEPYASRERRSPRAIISGSSTASGAWFITSRALSRRPWSRFPTTSRRRPAACIRVATS
jgi:hypothetical protein